jgi:uncharacterized protein
MSLKLRIRQPAMTPGGMEQILEYDPYRLTMRTGEGEDLLPKTVKQDWERNLLESRASIRLVVGKNCNQHCAYCSQESIKKNGDYLKDARNNHGVLHKTLDAILEFCRDKDMRIVLWGGEPLLYFRHLRRITEYLRERNPNLRFSTLSNGTLLTPEIADFLIRNEFIVTLSHDGPNHSLLRGKDFLEDAKLLPLVKRLAHELPNFTINSVIHRHNTDHLALFGHIADKLGKEVDFSVVDPLILLFDGAAKYLIPDAELPAYTSRFFRAFYEHSDIMFGHFRYYKGNIINFIEALRFAAEVPANIHCRTILNGVHAVDLLGNVLTCQNEDIFSKTESGESHVKGTIFNMGDLRSPKVGSWQHRPACRNCPVLFLCRNKCPHTPDRLHDLACKQYFHHYIVLFAAAIALFTNGGVLTGIEGEFKHSRSLEGAL